MKSIKKLLSYKKSFDYEGLVGEFIALNSIFTIQHDANIAIIYANNSYVIFELEQLKATILLKLKKMYPTINKVEIRPDKMGRIDKKKEMYMRKKNNFFMDERNLERYTEEDLEKAYFNIDNLKDIDEETKNYYKMVARNYFKNNYKLQECEICKCDREYLIDNKCLHCLKEEFEEKISYYTKEILKNHTFYKNSKACDEARSRILHLKAGNIFEFIEKDLTNIDIKKLDLMLIEYTMIKTASNEHSLIMDEAQKFKMKLKGYYERKNKKTNL